MMQAVFKHYILLITALLAVILAASASQARVNDSEDKELLPLIARVVRQIAFQGQSNRPRPPFPSRTQGQCDCQYLVTCAAQLDKITQGCQLPGGIAGVCCPPVGGGSGGLRTSSRTGTRSVFRQQSVPRASSNVNMNMVNSACRKGINDVERFSEIERNLLRKGIKIKRGTPASNHLRVFKTGQQTRELHKKAQQMAAATKHMASDFRVPGSELNKVDARNSILAPNCQKRPNCPNPRSRYRTASGECNNLNNPEWGRSLTALQRLLPPKYEDGMETPRNKSILGGQLPLARILANNILTDVDQPDLRFTLSVMQWAQFMDHDLSHSPFRDLKDSTGREEGIECCTEDFKMLPPDVLNKYCMPIEIPRNDGFFEPRGHTCMNFIRTRIVPPFDHECRFGHIEQINTLTQWIDGSTVYGQNQNMQNMLRANRGGLLRTSRNNFLPEDPGAAECDAPSRGGVCYMAGESRVNEQPGLTMMHTIWMRQHNRIARQLQGLNPRWSDDGIFQETRRIIAAQIAHITYNEWLPIIIGENFMVQYGLSPQSNGFSSDYDPSINANTNNEFSTAAFRFGHSLVQGIINLFSATGSVSSSRLRDNFMTGHLIARPGFFDGFLRGLTRQSSQKMDNFVTQELTNHLMQTPKFDFGMDLMSLNIQRGRDHAIGTYNEARELCGLGRARTFNDLTNTISPHIAQQLSRIYAHVDDIDMFVGGMAETSMPGAILGPTFLCIVGDQFARLKKGDRYFYELQGQAGQFSLEQLQEIRRTSWARVVCDNSENLDKVQPLAFRLKEDTYNNLVPCTSPTIPRMNLQPWQGLHPQA